MSAQSSGAPESLEAEGLERRKFIGQAGRAAGAVIAASVLPPIARASLTTAGEPLGPPASTALASSGEEDASWHIDDMWGHWPRYAHPIPHAGAAAAPVDWEHVDPIDRMLLI
jgi:phosphodiesterase/alkaline phosphatase D-like protein